MTAARQWPGQVLARGFFDRPAVEVAPEVLGCVLWHASPAGLVAGVLTEVEAYAGRADPASHAYRGQTARNAVMFGPPGHAYVYFTYGMHFCVNLVCEPAGQVSAILLRAARIVDGAALAAQRRQPRARPGLAQPAELAEAAAEAGRRPGPAAGLGRVLAERDLARGPARLCQALGIDRSLDGADVCGSGTPLGIGAPSGWAPPPASSISTGPRVGVSQAAEVPWRFWLTSESSVSAYRPAVPRHRAR
ncbi:MAG TPA: DNA-3-methyladenine glycosylase [Streptosporangiaceae bacterium]|jgi:DNA-3-methyladenine glycosylase